MAFPVTCDGGRAGCGDSLGVMGFTGERRCLVQAWGIIGGKAQCQRGEGGVPGPPPTTPCPTGSAQPRGARAWAEMWRGSTGLHLKHKDRPEASALMSRHTDTQRAATQRYAHTQTATHVHIYTRADTHTQKHTHIRRHTQGHTHIYIHACAQRHRYIHKGTLETHPHINTHKYIHTDTQIHSYT